MSDPVQTFLADIITILLAVTVTGMALLGILIFM